MLSLSYQDRQYAERIQRATKDPEYTLGRWYTIIGEGIALDVISARPTLCVETLSCSGLRIHPSRCFNALPTYIPYLALLPLDDRFISPLGEMSRHKATCSHRPSLSPACAKRADSREENLANHLGRLMFHLIRTPQVSDLS